MPTDSASIAPLLSKIEAAASAFLKTGNFPNDTERLALIRGAEQLAIAAREQEENLYFTATQVNLPGFPYAKQSFANAGIE